MDDWHREYPEYPIPADLLPLLIEAWDALGVPKHCRQMVRGHRACQREWLSIANVVQHALQIVQGYVTEQQAALMLWSLQQRAMV